MTTNSPILPIGALLDSYDLTVGIDRLKVRFPIDALVMQSLEDWFTLAGRGVGRGIKDATVTFPFNEKCNVWLGTRLHPRLGSHALVDFNPAKAVDPDGRRPASVSEVFSVLEELRPLLEEWIEGTDECRFWSVFGLHLTADVETSETQQVLSKATTALRTPRRKVQVFSNSSGDIESVAVRLKTRSNLLVYDKARESGVGPARIRFEVQMCRRDLLETFPMVGDFHPDSIREVFQQHFAPLIHEFREKPDCLGELNMSVSERRTFRELAGIEHLAILGHRETVSRSQRRRYQAFEERYPHHQVSDLV